MAREANSSATRRGDGSREVMGGVVDARRGEAFGAQAAGVAVAAGAALGVGLVAGNGLAEVDP